MARAGERGAMPEDRAGVGGGWVLFASIVMIVGGIFAFFEGLAALLKSGRFYTTVANYPYGGNVKTWGWIVLIAGIIVVLAGFDLPRAFQTADLRLIHAAVCRSRYSLRTCRGVRY